MSISFLILTFVMFDVNVSSQCVRRPLKFSENLEWDQTFFDA